MKVVRAVVACGFAIACAESDSPGPAARLSAGVSDTIIVNSDVPTALPVRALDAGGRTLVAAPIRYEPAGGDTVPVTPAGVVTCAGAGDFAVRAVLATLSEQLLVRCRPVDRLRMPGPVQFVLGDSALSRPVELPVEAYAAGGRPIALVAGIVQTLDTSVAFARGGAIVARSRGITLVGAWVGGRNAWTGVHVYQRVDSMAALDTLLRVDPHQRLFAIAISLRPGELRRHALPSGDWMVTTLPGTPGGPSPFRLRFEHASCQPNVLNDPGRFGCRTSPGAAVTVYRPTGTGDPSSATGYLLVRGFFPPRDHYVATR